MKLIVLSGAILILLTVAKALSPYFFVFLPLGGSVIAEMGIVFGLSVAATTIHQIMRGENGKNSNHDNS